MFLSTFGKQCIFPFENPKKLVLDMQNVKHIAQNAGHSAQNDGRTMQNDIYIKTSGFVNYRIDQFIHENTFNH